MARRITASVHDAEEISQDVFVRFWHGDGFDPDRGTVRSWLAMKAHGAAVDRVRTEVSRRRREAGEARALNDGHVRDAMQDSETAREVSRALGQLTQVQRESIVLAYYEGLSHREIAEWLGLPLGTIKTRIRDGMLQLTRIVQHEVRLDPDSWAC